MKTSVSVIVVICSILNVYCNKINKERQFPKDFLFGTASSAYQIEGACNEDGKGENNWDYFTHLHPNYTSDSSNGDIACDSYHKIEEDVTLLRKLGVQFYRFSLSWTRILPTGFTNKINPKGVQHYNKLIDLLLANNITPMVTIFHWDLPQSLQILGGFANELIVNWFVDYARICFENFGDRVKMWQTLNEPKNVCVYGYGNIYRVPAFNLSGIADYICTHNMLKAHAKVYHLYDENFRQKQQGQISIAIDADWLEAKTESLKDYEIAERRRLFEIGHFADPIFHPHGDYPEDVKTLISELSKKEGFFRPRLPVFTEDEIQYIRGTYDYFSVNHYTSYLVDNAPDDTIEYVSRDKDSQTKTFAYPALPKIEWWFQVVPSGLTKALKWIRDRYGDLDIYVTENGIMDYGGIEDKNRISYHKDYLNALLDAIYDYNISVKGYSAWSFLDSFEWQSGYTLKFGLHHVNFSDPNRTRTPKLSAEYYKNVIRYRKTDVDYKSVNDF